MLWNSGCAIRRTSRTSDDAMGGLREDEFSASVLFLSSRYMVALRFEDLPGFDGMARRTPFLLGRTRSSKSGFVLLSMTIVISWPPDRSSSPAGMPGFAVS
jgi:hypothetical protein